MEFSVRISPVVNKRLKVLRKGDGNSAQAARHARAIMDQVLEGIFSPRRIGRLTRSGEARITNCVKFDLVRGYRLIAVLGEGGICFVFVGSHDECDHWIRNNSGIEYGSEACKGEPVRVKCGKKEGGSRAAGDDDEDEEAEPDYNPPSLVDLTDSDLQKIFCGLAKR